MRVTPFTFESLIPEHRAAASGEVLAAPEEAVVEEAPAPTFSEAELEIVKRDAHDEGFLAGKKEGLREVEKESQVKQEQMLAVVSSIDEQLSKLQQEYDQVLRSRQKEIGRLVMTCAEKLAGEALRKDPVSDIAEMVESALNGLFDAPKIIALVHPSLAPMLKERLPRNVTIDTDESVHPANCTLMWQHGQAMRDTARIWQEIETIILRHFEMQSAANETPSNATEIVKGENHE